MSAMNSADPFLDDNITPTDEGNNDTDYEDMPELEDVNTNDDDYEHMPELTNDDDDDQPEFMNESDLSPPIPIEPENINLSNLFQLSDFWRFMTARFRDNVRNGIYNEQYINDE